MYTCVDSVYMCRLCIRMLTVAGCERSKENPSNWARITSLCTET